MTLLGLRYDSAQVRGKELCLKAFSFHRIPENHISFLSCLCFDCANEHVSHGRKAGWKDFVDNSFCLAELKLRMLKILSNGHSSLYKESKVDALSLGASVMLYL